MPMNERIYIGCSGYYYPYWKNRFYPQGLQPKNWLGYYASVFNTVELNGTFYRLPKLADLQKYASGTPGDFKFSVKMSRYVTHVLRLKDAGEAVGQFAGLVQEGLGHKLANILFQLPPSFQYTPENLQRVLEIVPHTNNHVVEFRHISWWNEAVRAALAAAGITFCNVDFPGLDSFPVHTTGVFYFRFHGNPELFKSSYSQEQLRLFAEQLPGNKSCFIYFNNTFYEAGFRNAEALRAIISSPPGKHSGP
jgi:uncharacterized protein YecE (DUF72 family)